MLEVIAKRFELNPNFTLIQGDCIEVMNQLDPEKFDLIFADPPYLLSNDGITCQSGKMVKVNKGEWDRSNGFVQDVEFTRNWLNACKRVLKKTGTIWISGTSHIIYKVGYLLQELGFKIINDIIWFKPNAPPNLSCRYFTHSHETILWAKKNNKEKHFFNYELMKFWNDSSDKIKNNDKQMRSVWWMPLIPQEEKQFGSHPTQKPLELLNRIISASSKKGDWVLDPFNGSGTTGIASNLLKRKYIGIEIEKKFIEVTINRFKNRKKIKLYQPIKKKEISQKTLLD
ncbi:MAG: DNA-methyltransferase [Candidatus Helarchaeota archaeon]